MNPRTFAAFSEELALIYGIEKDAGLRDTLKAGTDVIRKGGQLGNKLALKGMAKAHSLPFGSHIVNHLTSMDAQEMAHSLAGFAR